MLSTNLISFYLGKDREKTDGWHLWLFGWVVPGSKVTGDRASVVVEYLLKISLMEILMVRRSVVDGVPSVYRRIPLLAAILGPEVEKTIVSKEPRKVMFKDNEYEITEYTVKKGYRLFMPLFHYSETPKVSVRSNSVKVFEHPFYLREWTRLNLELTDNDIIRGSIRMTRS